METIIHAKTIDKKVRLALYGMLHHSATKLFPRRMKYVSIKLHLKHYVYDGVAMIEEDTKITTPRNFKIIIDPYRLEKDDWGRGHSACLGLLEQNVGAVTTAAAILS